MNDPNDKRDADAPPSQRDTLPGPPPSFDAEPEFWSDGGLIPLPASMVIATTDTVSGKVVDLTTYIGGLDAIELTIQQVVE